MAVELDERLERYADLAVRVGANVQPGQTVFIGDLRASTRRSHARSRAPRIAPARGTSTCATATSTCAAR